MRNNRAQFFRVSKTINDLKFRKKNRIKRLNNLIQKVFVAAVKPENNTILICHDCG